MKGALRCPGGAFRRETCRAAFGHPCRCTPGPDALLDLDDDLREITTPKPGEPRARLPHSNPPARPG